MYLAPLNYDRFFHKVFSDLKITKKFLEDFFNIEIESIDFFKDKHSITDDAVVVEFGFRCKIEGSYIIIDMQQWYKMDVVQRFHLYHALDTGLQLEGLPKREIILRNKIVKSRDYRELEPVITLIWMVHDSLGYEDDFVQFSMSPAILNEFMHDMKLWSNPDIVKVLKKRDEILKVLNNKTKSLDFISENKLTFMFQKNIVKNNNMNKYTKWFDFAEKTKNKANKEEDFEDYLNDDLFLEMIRRLKREILTEDEIRYIENEEESEKWIRIEDKVYEDGREDGLKEGKKEGKKEGRKEGRKEGLIEGEIMTYKNIMENSSLPQNLLQDYEKKIEELQNKLQEIQKGYI